MMKIIADANIPFVKECFSSIGEVAVVGGREITPWMVADADILLVRSITPVGVDLLAGSKVRFVGTATIGFDHIDIDFLTRSKIGFASAPGSNANSAAEYVIAGLLEIGQKYALDLEGKSIGIIGVGNVGGRVAKKCAALGMDVYLNDPPLKRQTGDEKYLPLEGLFDCDFITLHTPLTFDGPDKTHHLADEKFFKSLKERCVFINASRGGVVDGGTLKSAIQAGRLRATVLDVWEDEQDIDIELLKMVDIGTPHIAGYSLDGKIVGMIMIYRAACEYFAVEPKFDIEDFLPKPAVPELKLDTHITNDQKALLSAVRKIYRIDKDDARLRRILVKPAEGRGKYFDGLRKNYPERREFKNTSVIVKDTSSKLAKKLIGIGFKEVKSSPREIDKAAISRGKSKKTKAESNGQSIVEWPSGKLDFSAGCLVMGILNVTPDSFSDGGKFFNPSEAIEHGLEMAADGAAIIDIGGESTRPGSEPVTATQQIKRVVPVIEALCERSNVPVSIDTYKLEVAEAALEAGAAMINDITALSDERVGELAAERRVPVVLMHMQGTPATMQVEPKYDDVVGEVLEFLLSQAERAGEFGISKDMIFIDPGIGFGKTTEHNLLLLRNIDKFVAPGYRVLIGTSRKRFIGEITGKEEPAERIFGTAATVTLCAAAGVSIVRVHDVAEMADVVKVVNAINDL
jgi:dihydropteroate synthase